MIKRTTKQIVESDKLLKKMYEKDTRSFDFWNPILSKEDERVWVDLESLKKDIEKEFYEEV